jgi:quinol monooxygenase YgiN
MASELEENADLSRLLPGRLGLVVRLHCQTGTRPAILDALHSYADRLFEEPGTEAFVISLDPSSGDTVWLFEWFKDSDAWEEHRRAPAFVDLMESLSDRLSEPPGLLRLDPLRLNLSKVLLTPSQDGTF